MRCGCRSDHGFAGPGLSGARRSRSSVPCFDLADGRSQSIDVKVEDVTPAEASSNTSRVAPASCEISRNTRPASSLCEPSTSVCDCPQLQIAADVLPVSYAACKTRTCSVGVCRVVSDYDFAFGGPSETGCASRVQDLWPGTAGASLAGSILPDCNDAVYDLPLLNGDSDGHFTCGWADTGENWAANLGCVAIATNSNSSEGRSAASMVGLLPAVASDLRPDEGPCLLTEAALFGAETPLSVRDAALPLNYSSWITSGALSADFTGCAPALDQCDTKQPPMLPVDPPPFGKELNGPSPLPCGQLQRTDDSAFQPDARQGFLPVGPLPSGSQTDALVGSLPTRPHMGTVWPREALCCGRVWGIPAAGGPSERSVQVGPRAEGAAPRLRGRPRRHDLALISGAFRPTSIVVGE